MSDAVRQADIDSGKAVRPVNISATRLTTGKIKSPIKAGIYGEPGSGKTTLAADARKAGLNPVVIDVNDGSHEHDVARIDATQVDTWEKLMAILRPDAEIQGPKGPIKLWKEVENTMCVLDTITDCQELAEKWIIENVKHEKGAPIARIEDYGWGKGYSHIAHEMNRLFAALDRLVAAGVHVCTICHRETVNVPNPGGEDFLQWTPMLLSSPKANVRQKYIGWLKHLFYLGFDQAIEGGKAIGSGTRSIIPISTPSLVAKSRSIKDVMPCRQGTGELWKALLG